MAESAPSGSDLNSPAASKKIVQICPPLKRKEMSEDLSSEQNADKKYRTSNETAQELLDLLQCPVCLDVPRAAPIFSCRNGHLICGKCKPKVSSCPICRSKDVGIRNVFVEKFVSFIKIHQDYL